MSTTKRRPKAGKRTGSVDWAKVRSTSDEDIARQIEEDPDTAPDVSDWDLSKAKLVRPLQPAK